jgi:phosphohistidine swiveling domain-containing protein
LLKGHRSLANVNWWHHHTEFLMLGYGAYVVFFEFCKQAFPEIPDQMVARMVAGVEVIMYRPDDELKRLARLAVECGVDDLFEEGCDPASVLEALRGRGEAGGRWLAGFEQARDPWFNVSTGDGFYHHHRSWADDLTVPFAALPRYVRLVRGGESLERPTEQLRQERERIVAEYRGLLGGEEERAAFDQMLGLCRVVFPYVEDHKFYCEHWFTTRFFQKIRAFGELLRRQGVLADAEDVFQLHHDEVDQALADVMLAWASGGRPLGGAHFQPIVAERKRLLAALRDWAPPPALGPVPEALNDPAVKMLWGVTAQTLEAWSSASDADGREIHGYAASPGVVEGVARVLRDVNEIGQIREGEILVCPVTAPSWGPVFGKIKAAVSDIGGTMSHAAIVAREYGMPAVVGTGQATQPHQDRPAAAGRRRPWRRPHPGLRAMTTAALVRSLAGTGGGDRPTVGGKCASLGELIGAGLRVPPGFVVTTAAFQQAMGALDPDRSIVREVAELGPDDHDTVVRVTAEVRERIRSAPLPDELAAAIADWYRSLGEEAGPGVPVAVRSSATAEDSAEASFAGLQDTYLWVSGADVVVDRVRACWASLYSVESVSYRLRRGLPEEAMAMGVVVQRMVDARCSGVMFTRSPTTGDRSVVAIEASWGLGSAVVSGLVTPDTYVVNKVTGELLERTVSSKLRQHRPDPAGHGVVDDEVPERLRDRPCLSDDEVGALLRAARLVEHHYGSSQDVEWAISREPDDRLFLLQSRPETVWSRRAPEPVATPKARAFDHVVALLGSTGTGKQGGGARR